MYHIRVENATIKVQFLRSHIQHETTIHFALESVVDFILTDLG